MNAMTKLIGRIAFAAAAVALLVGLSSNLVGAQPPIDIDSGPMLVARGLCVGSGGDWELTNNMFFCTYPDGHGWKCDMETNPVQCSSFFKLPKGKITVNIGSATMANAQVASSTGDSSGLPVNLSSVQAQIAGARVAATPQPTPTRVKVATAGKVNIAIASAP